MKNIIERIAGGAGCLRKVVSTRLAVVVFLEFTHFLTVKVHLTPVNKV